MYMGFFLLCREPPLLFHPHGEDGDVSGRDAADAAGLAEARGPDGRELFAGFVAEARNVIVIYIFWNLFRLEPFHVRDLFHLFFDVTFVAALDLDLRLDLLRERGEVRERRAELLVVHLRAFQ